MNPGYLSTPVESKGQTTTTPISTLVSSVTTVFCTVVALLLILSAERSFDLRDTKTGLQSAEGLSLPRLSFQSFHCPRTSFCFPPARKNPLAYCPRFPHLPNFMRHPGRLPPSFKGAVTCPVSFIVQELCESRGGRPELSVLTSLLVSVDVKNY